MYLFHSTHFTIFCLLCFGSLHCTVGRFPIYIVNTGLYMARRSSRIFWNSLEYSFSIYYLRWGFFDIWRLLAILERVSALITIQKGALTIVETFFRNGNIISSFLQIWSLCYVYNLLLMLVNATAHCEWLKNNGSVQC